MSKARLTFETTKTLKIALETALDESGVSLPEWFEGTVADTAGSLFGTWLAKESQKSKTSTLSPIDLDQPEKVFEAIEGINWAFADEQTRYLSHDIHPYPAKFIPQLPHYLIQLLSRPGETVLDPFGGSGTTALEATLLDRNGLSSDANPLAAIIGTAKTATLRREDDEELSQLIERLLLLASRPNDLRTELKRYMQVLQPLIPSEATLSHWFASSAIEELAYGLWCIHQLSSEIVRSVALASFSKSVLKASFQDGETRYTKKPREVTHGEILKLLAANLSLNQKKVRQLGPLLQFRQPIFKTVDLRIEGAVGEDGLNSWDAECADLIVTSPPYPNATDYHLYHRFRLLWLGFDPRILGKQEIGSHLRHQRQKSGFEVYVEEMTRCLHAMYKALKPGRYAVLVLGDGVFKGQTYQTSQALLKAGQQIGFEPVGEVDRPLPENKRSFVAAARRLRQEQILVLRRPIVKQQLLLLAPPYTLWPYETNLREREITALIGEHPQVNGDDSQENDGRKGRTLYVSCSSQHIRHLNRLTFTHGIRHVGSNHVEPTWQAILENGDAKNPSARKDPKYVTHGIHGYKGKFYPQLAKSLFNLANLAPGQRVLDPFCGSGTVLLEAYINGLHGYGLDIHPLAVHIATAKTQVLNADTYWTDRLLGDCERTLERWMVERVSNKANQSEHQVDIAWQNTFVVEAHEELASWFPLPVLSKLAQLWQYIEEVPEPQVRILLEVTLSSIVRDISHQDPRDLRIRRRVEPLEDAPVFALFAAKVSEVRKRLHAFASARSHASAPFGNVKVTRGDGRDKSSYESVGIGNKSIDAVVTSPPYATALPYIDTDRLSLLLLFALRSKERTAIEDILIGSREISPKKRVSIDNLIDAGVWDGIPSVTARDVVMKVRQNNEGAEQRGEAVGFRRKNTAALLYLYFRDMATVFTNLDDYLKPSANAFFVIGDSRTVAGGEEVCIASSQVLQELGQEIGWTLREVIPITVTTEDRPHFKNSITTNSVLWFFKN